MPTLTAPRRHSDVTLYCPKCGTLETVLAEGKQIVRTQHFRQCNATGKIYHCQHTPCKIIGVSLLSMFSLP